jgi:hypothetical protein
MSWGESNSQSMSALAAAEVRFPDKAGKIQELFQTNEAFRNMCEDLVAAVEALAHLEGFQEKVRDARREEYEGLVDALVWEIGEALRQSNVVILRRSGKTQSKSPGV